MIFTQYYLGCLSQASYLIGDESTRTAVVVDPRRDVDEYVDDAAGRGLKIAHVILTHFHADFVAGHLELRDRVGARIHLGARAQADYDFSPLRDGDTLELGRVRLRVLETPGHTPEAISLLLYDLAVSDREPHAVLTGDTLFIGDVGRPDLMASVGLSAPELAGMLYDSLHEKLLTLPDATLVYPGHGAGSACGKHLGQERMSTIGVQRQHNYALQPMSKQRFVETITAELPAAPPYFAHDADLNRRERPTLDTVLARELHRLPLEAVLAAQRDGAQLLDVRDPADFAAGHLASSLNIGLGGRFAEWAGILLSPARPIVLVSTPGRESEAAIRLARVGFDAVVGYLDGGIEAAKDRPDLVKRVERVTAAALREIRQSDRIPILDVRTEAEWRNDPIPGSVNVPLNQLRARLADVPPGPRIVVHCQTGLRSSTAASLLEQVGRTGVVDLVGGIVAWKLAAEQETAMAGRPAEPPRRVPAGSGGPPDPPR
jgi:glyoxylase-like metal-dependent hydrolase (beta-lactamase superfamily II)/rhodanese-related sulfurtransferase